MIFSLKKYELSCRLRNGLGDNKNEAIAVIQVRGDRCLD